ncbi:MAG: regulatory protein RecX [Clostridia bacterium]|nr:regulatory protein RecX [Clostridia bacterium]
MIITKLVPAKKKLTLVYIDGEYAMKLDTQILFEECVKVGSVVDDDRLHDLIEKSEYKRAKEKALWLLSQRDYSRKKLTEKLKAEASEDVCEKVCERMEEVGLLNDESYAKRLSHDLIHIKRLSTRGALYKLLEKGIDRELAEEVLSEFDTDPVEQLVEIIERKYSDKLADEKLRRRTVAALQRLGYSWSDIKAAIEKFEE